MQLVLCESALIDAHLLNFTRIPTDHHMVEMRARRQRTYIAVVVDATGATYGYPYSSPRSRREAEDEARQLATRWGGTLVELAPTEKNGSGNQLRRLLVVAGYTFVLLGTATAATMIIVLTLEGAL